MELPITNLNDFVASTPWLQQVRREKFSFTLTDGWYEERPFDERHVINEIMVNADRIRVVYDDIRELEVVSPKSFELKSLGPFSSLKLTTNLEVILRFTPYGQEKTGRRIERTYRPAEDNSLILIGYFPLDDKNS